VITQPSPGLTLRESGLYEISGLAWSGYGKVTEVEVSADGGKSWAPAVLQPPVLSKALTRFRIPWRWNGGPAVSVPGYETLVTHVFAADSPYLDGDAVFGVKNALIREFTHERAHSDGYAASGITFCL
jgi:Mo-co oxidoreductase dimerisation domain